MRAVIIAVGSELLTPFRVDTNSLFVTERLNELGIEVQQKVVVADRPDDVRIAVHEALGRAELVVVTGGLGPTEDDVTREAVAEALGVPLQLDARILQEIEARFASRGLQMPRMNRRQAMVPGGARVLDNPRGTAPGLVFEPEGRMVVLLPGPPREMQGMLERVLRERVAPRAGADRLFRRALRIIGRTESHTEEAVAPLYETWRRGAIPIAATILASQGQIELHLTARARDDTAARAVLAEAVGAVEARIGRDLLSADGRTLEAVVGDLLVRGGHAIGLAESCTGGLIASRMTDVPGSSRYVQVGVVAYSNQAKIERLQVPEPLLAAHGAVSEPVAVAMARGVCAGGGADIGVGVTGVAGPGGGSPAKPVGTVAIAVARPPLGPDAVRVQTFRFLGERALVKSQAALRALDLVRRWLLDAP